MVVLCDLMEISVGVWWKERGARGSRGVRGSIAAAGGEVAFRKSV